MLSLLRSMLFVYAFVAAGYYLVCLGLLWRTMGRTRNLLERQHVRWVLTAACLAAVPVAYTLVVGSLDRSRLALGNAQLALFLVSLLLGVGYVGGLISLRRVLLDEVADHGLTWSLLSIGATLLLAAAVAVASIAVLSGVAPGTGSPTLAALTLTTAVLLAWWVRGKLQNAIDARYAEPRYGLDLALSRLQPKSAPANDELARHALVNCRDVIGLSPVAFLMAAPSGEEDSARRDIMTFESVDALDREPPPAFEVEGQTLRELAEAGPLPGGQPSLVQRAPGGNPDVQRIVQAADAAAVQPVVVEGQVRALLALGSADAAAALSPEDAAFLVALAQVTGLEMQSAAVGQRLQMLGDELRTRVDQVDSQQRRIRELESELAAISRQEDLRAEAAETADGATAAIRGSSPAIRTVLQTVRKVAPSEASVLLRGESGTGKELLARAIHDGSARADGPLVSLHCAALSPSLLESELFGHVKGAFTDARSDKVGRFEQAHGGTLFFDEVGDIPLPVQVKLLRVLQERRFEPVGSNQTQEVDVRVIAATHQNLEALIEAGRFREDLYYRLNVVTLPLPPLRERGGDIVELATHFLAEFAARRDAAAGDGKATRSGSRAEPSVRFDAAAIAALEAFDWPGNVRQLRNVIERALVLSDGVCIRRGDLPVEIQQAATRPVAQRVAVAAGGDVGRFAPASTDRPSERETLSQALAAADGNKTAAARQLGLPRSTFFSKLKKHGLA